MKNKNSGFTLVEVIVAIALIGIISIGIIPAFAAQFKMTVDTKNITTMSFDAQGEFENVISELKNALVDPVIDEKAIAGVTETEKTIFGRQVTMYKLNSTFPSNENKNFLVFLSKKLAQMEVRQLLVAKGVRIEVSNETVHELADLKKSPKPTLTGKVDTNTDPNWYANLYKWYVSNEGDSDPVFPDDYERISFTGVTPAMLNDLSKVANRYIVFTVTPVDIHGVRGNEVASINKVYVLGEEWRSGIFAWVDKNADASYSDKEDILIDKKIGYKWHLLDGFDTADTFLNPADPSKILDPKNGSLYVPMCIDRAASDRVGPINVSGADAIDWKVDKSIHLATDISVNNNTDINMETRDGNIILYQYIKLDPRTGNAAFDSKGKPVTIDYGPGLSAPRGSITLQTSGRGDIILQKFAGLNAGDHITLRPYGHVNVFNSILNAGGSITLDATKGLAFPGNRDIAVKNTTFTLNPNSTPNRSVYVGSLNALAVADSTFNGNTGAASKVKLSAPDGIDMSEVNFANAIIELDSRSKIKGGGWDSGSSLRVADGRLLTIGVENTKVNNAGDLILGNTGAVDFVNTMSDDLNNPLVIMLGKGDADNEVAIATNYGRNVGYADSSSYESIGVLGNYQSMGSGQTNMRYAVEKLYGNGSAGLSCAFDGNNKLSLDASGTGPISGYYRLTVEDKYVEEISGSIIFSVSAGEGEDPVVHVIGSKIPEYTVTFLRNDGTDQVYTIKGVSDGTAISEFPSAPTRTGYNFAGWNTKADGTGSSFADTTIVTGNISIYAQWTRIPSYTVTFNKNGGNTEANPSSREVLSGSTIGTLPEPPVRYGYRFDKWTNQPVGGAVINEQTVITAPLTAYAQWGSKKTYAQINDGEYVIIKNTSNQDVIFQKISASQLLLRDRLLSGSNDAMNWNAANTLAGNYKNNFPAKWGIWDWITASGLVDGGTLNSLSADSNKRSSILATSSPSYSWWGGSLNSSYSYLVNANGTVTSYVDRNNSDYWRGNRYSCRPYLTVNTTNLYVSSGSGTPADPYILVKE